MYTALNTRNAGKISRYNGYKLKQNDKRSCLKYLIGDYLYDRSSNFFFRTATYV